MKRKLLGGEAAQGIAGGHAEIKTDKEKKKHDISGEKKGRGTIKQDGINS